MQNFWKIDRQLLLEESYCYYIKHPQLSCIDYTTDLIDEDTYFNHLPEQFLNKIIEYFLDMYQHKQAILNLKLNTLLSLIKQEEIINYRGFYTFLKNLETLDNLELSLQIGFSNEFQLPNEFNELKEANYPTEKLDITLKDKIKTCKNFNDILNKFNQYLSSIIELGTIIIKSSEFSNIDELKITITHKVRYFFHFLVRLNAKLYSIFNWYSAQNFEKFNLENLNFKSYYLDENEFITNASTVIDRLKNILTKYRRKNISLNSEKLSLIKSVLFLAGSNEKLSDNYWIDILQNNLTIKIQHIINFYQEILNDHKWNIENSIIKHDKLKKLIIWTYKEL